MVFRFITVTECDLFIFSELHFNKMKALSLLLWMASITLVHSMISTMSLTPQDDISKYNISDVHIQLGPGDYYLTSDLVLENVRHFLLTGTKYTKIKCTTPVGIIAINASFLVLQNLTLINCAKQHDVHVMPSYFTYRKIKLENYNATIILHH